MYIFWFLHQTTTTALSVLKILSCISFDSYIKPQRFGSIMALWWVVYLLIPTSNHNSMTTSPVSWKLYIFWFLHQTTTMVWLLSVVIRCISFDSYIKPQRCCQIHSKRNVVYLLIPTSNHNSLHDGWVWMQLYIFWFLHQTTTYRFEHTDFQRITNTLSNKKWWVGYNF